MIFCTSAPKSGTHLLAKVIENLTGRYTVTIKRGMPDSEIRRRSNAFPNIGGHFRLKDFRGSEALMETLAERSLFILIRDPRDVCASMVTYLARKGNYEHQQAFQCLADLEGEAAIMRVAEGFDSGDSSFRQPSIEQACAGFLEIRQLCPWSTVLRYEEFFTPEAAQKIAAGLGLDQDIVQGAISSALISDTRTKHTGTPRVWLTFSDELKDYFREKHSRLIERLGYDVEEPNV